MIAAIDARKSTDRAGAGDNGGRRRWLRRQLEGAGEVSGRRRARGPTFQAIEHAVWEEIVHATKHHALLTRVVFPIYNARQLRRTYPLIVPSLRHVFTGAVLLGLCRLFEENGHASLTAFLARVPPIETPDDEAAARRRFLQTVPQFRHEIAIHWRRLVLHRNGYLAHVDLTKAAEIERAKLTYRDMHDALQLAQRIYGGYRGERDPAVLPFMFEPSELRSEPDQFLRAHFELEAGK